MTPTEALDEIERLVADENDRPIRMPIQPILQAIRAKFPGTVAILFYGSCLRTGSTDGLLDFYALVEHYEDAFGSRLLALGARLVPPNVYHLTLQGGLRAKVAVLELGHFETLVSPQAGQSSVWARFCQPTALVFASDPGIAKRVHRANAQAVATAARMVLPLLPPEGTPEAIWTGLFGMTFGAEFRTERSDRPSLIQAYDAARYEALTRPAIVAGGFAYTEADGLLTISIGATQRAMAGRIWRRMRVAGKSLTLIRLIKAAYTFENGVDYLIWKAERHSGQKLELSAFARAHPILCAPVVLWRFWRRGVFR